MIDSSYHNYNRFGEVDNPSGGGGLFKRQALLEVGGYFERFNASEEPILGRMLREHGKKIILIDEVMAYHDLGIYNLKAYLLFRARQARQLANMLLLNERVDPTAYALAWKQLAEFFLIIVWASILIVLGSYRYWFIAVTILGLLFFLLYKYTRYQQYKRRFTAFTEIFLVGKPFHIMFQMYYLVKGLLKKNHPANIPDGQIISDSEGLIPQK